ncbi:MAG: hypothetical protein SFT92_06635 [Rickettsiales bacterium]|nr:hypothetical protein [Rickettsiales bacterium]
MFKAPSAETCAAGLFSASLFLATVYFGLGLIFLFIPTLPLFHIGLRHPNLFPALLASFIVYLIGGSQLALVFFFVFALPTHYICRHALRYESDEIGQATYWYPMGRILSNLALYSCLFMVIITAYYLARGMPIHELLSERLGTAIAELRKDLDMPIQPFSAKLVFLIFSITAWFWVLFLYGSAWVSHKLLASKHRNVRPLMSIELFVMPAWMLQPILICGLASLIGSPTMQFLGNACLLTLMLPYFFLGVAVMHETSKSWPSRRFFLFFVYFIMITQFFPVMILSGIGLWHHIKRLSAGASSSI